MGENVKMYGTKRAIVDSILTQLQIQNPEEIDVIKRYVDTLIDSVEINYQCLGDDERIRKETPRGYDSNHGFLTEDAVYYINIKKFTFILFSVIVKLNMERVFGSVMFAFIENLFEAQFQGEDLALFHKLSNTIGECCIALEARTARKKGISKSHFTKKCGLRTKLIMGKECVHNDICCGLRRGTQCLCDEEQTEAICERLVEDRILIKKGKKYYYTDFL